MKKIPLWKTAFGIDEETLLSFVYVDADKVGIHGLEYETNFNL